MSRNFVTGITAMLGGVLLGALVVVAALVLPPIATALLAGVGVAVSVLLSTTFLRLRSENRSLAQSVGDAAAQQAAQTGSRIVDRELEVRPTLRVRAGAPVRVLVARDIELRPYIGPRSEAR